ncbi:MAG: hypothetical protein EPN93_07605 [Spirochaetes bacterium]|nr:MAG: hypothetical protein EPN93_07605 [Spirochaetota bacterium]
MKKVTMKGGVMRMKRTVSILLVWAAILPCAGAYASRLHQEDGIYPNQSAEYVRTLNRNASREADAAFYNPAGLAFMERDGLYVMFSSQTYYARREHTMDYYAIDLNGGGAHATAHSLNAFSDTLPGKYYAETTAPALPDLNVVWRRGGQAAYFGVGVMQAAPGMTFPKGLAVIDWGNLATPETLLEQDGSNDFYSFQSKAEAVRTEYYIGMTAGYAYEVYKGISVAGGLRYINAHGNMKIAVTDISYTYQTGSAPETVLVNDWNIDVDTQGHGAGVILGAHFRPGEYVSVLKGTDIGLRYEYYAPMVLKKTTNKFLVPENLESSGKLDIFKDGTSGKDMIYQSPGGNGQSTLKVTYPQTISMGISYSVLPSLRVEASGEISLRQYRDLDGRENDYGLGYRAGACIEWALSPAMRVSLGYVYNNFGIKDSARDEADQLLSSHSVGAGVGIRLDDRTDISIGIFKMFFVKETQYTTEYTNVVGPTTHYLRKSYDENRFSMGVGVTYRMFGAGGGADPAGLTLGREREKETN